jgi:hypothetical protein
MLHSAAAAAAAKNGGKRKQRPQSGSVVMQWAKKSGQLRQQSFVTTDDANKS